MRDNTRFLTKLPYGGSYWQLDDVEIMAMPVPGAPTGLAATLAGNSDVILGWNGSDGAKYTLERSADGGAWTQIADLTDGATTYVDKSGVSFTPYQYRVRAYNAAGQSAYSAPASVTTGDKTVRYVDVTISLYAGAPIDTPADRAKYEAVIGYFADAVYESSNGVNRIRKVTIYRDAKNFDTAHIQWIPSCHPNAHTGGYIRPGTGVRVEMCDVFNTTQFLATVKGQQDGGGTIAHEWGHFFYGMYDEYKGSGTSYSSPQATDPGSSTSVMTSQWGGFANLNRFNFSTPVLNFTLQSAQGRVFGADAWTVLSRPKNEDPQNSAAANRPYWPELAAVKPAEGTTDIDLPDATARAALQIVWEPGFAARATHGPNAMLAATNNVIREVVIDRSALMADSGYLDAVKSAVATLIDQSVTGDTLGLIAFDGTATVVQPLTDITDQATKDTLVAALDGIAAGDADAAGGDALQMALTALTAPSVPTDTTRVVYFITTGSNNTGINPTTVMPGYQAAGIALHIFGFDPLDGNEANLRLLAELTQGEYTTVQDVGNLQKALGLAGQDTSPAQDVTLAYDFSDIVPGDPAVYTIAVDETLNRVNFEITYYGEAYSATITLLDPDNIAWSIDPAADCETSGAGADAKTTCYVGFLNPGIGDWTVTIEATNTVIFVSDYETGVAAAGETTYAPVITVVGGNVIEYPQPMVIEAKVSRDYPIGGLFARGWVLEPDGSFPSVMTLRDDGVAPDAIADDGVYSAYVDYTQNGEHLVTVHFDNYDGAGFYTDKGLMTTDPISLPAVTEDFERYAEVQVTVNGWQADDHANWPDDPNWPATALTLDNIPTPGRIDYDNDDDVFAVTVPADYAEETLGVRLNRLGLGMDPYVVVYAADYSWQFVRYLDYVPTSDDTLFIPVDAQPGETFYVEVWHYEVDRTGTYNISAGPYLWSDPIAKGKGTYGLTLTPGMTQTILPGQTLTYTHLLTNTGDQQDQVALEVQTELGWDVQLYMDGVATETVQLPVILAPGAGIRIELLVTAPVTDVLSGDTESITLTATSSYSPATALATDRAIIGAVPAFTFAPDRAAAVAPNTQAVYTHTLVNTGNGPLAFTFQHHSSRAWQVSYQPALTLTAGQSATVVITVTVPSGVANGIVDTTHFTAAAASLVQSVTDTTTVHSAWTIFLPLVTKN